ncbi:hypothetical protein ID866_3866 [Astraeus odoratus]|nr:hypothetical protein ID866_3866 [Astraeus odoratus]
MSVPELLSYTSFPSRGFHSTLSANIALNNAVPGCSAFVLYTLPPSIIIDRYELADRNITFELRGESNLELPVFAVDQLDTLLLLDVTHVESPSNKISVDIPVHVRYGPPLSGDAPRQSIRIPPPVTFWACHEPVDALYPLTPHLPIVQFAMLQPYTHFSMPGKASSLPPTELDIPLGSLDDLPLVEAGTTAVVLIIFAWLLYRSWTCAGKLRAQHLKQQ